MSAMSSPILGLMTGGSSGEHHVDLKPTDNSDAEDALRAAETVYQLAMRQISEEVEVSQELLIYPEGEVDAVTITERDVEGLQPERFLSNNIVDFYIRFLIRGLCPERGNRFYFFSSFFFSKLLQSTASTGIDPCKVDYKELRKWTKEVNLFAKDHVFIPILKSSHWSLVILCHLSNLTRPPGEMTRSPCVVHLDPIEGQHESFEVLIRSYILQAWMERFQVSNNGDQLLALCQMKYVEAKVPQQDNFHDCGLYVLNYIEAFFKESTSSDFSFTSSESGPHFFSPQFVSEVVGKRERIRNLIHELSGISQKRARKRRAIQEVLQSTENLRFLVFHEGNFEACIKDMQTAGPTFFNGQGSKINHASTHEDALNFEDRQSTLMVLRGNNERKDGAQIGPTKYEDRSESLSPKQQYVEPQVRIGDSTHEDALDFEDRQSTLMVLWGNNEQKDGAQIGPTKYEDRSESLSPKQQYVEPKVQLGDSTHFNGSIFMAKHASTHVDAIDVQHHQSSGISRLDGPKLQLVEHQRVDNDMLRRPTLEEVSSMDMFEGQKGKNKRGRNMTKEETWVLLSCMVEGGRFCQGSGGRTHWNLICEEIGKKPGSLVSADQCRLRYDTLLKAYKTYKKHCLMTGKVFSAIMEAERLDLKLATTLSEEMYTTMDEIHEFRNKANISHKRMKLTSNVCNDLHPLSLVAPNPPPISLGRSFEDGDVVSDRAPGTIEVALCKALCKVIPVSVFSFLNADLQSTLLYLVQECSFLAWFSELRKGMVFKLTEVCQRVAILQDREPREIFNYVFQLWKLDFVNVADMVFEEGGDPAHIDLWAYKTWFLKSEFYEKISKEVLCKNTQFLTYCNSYPMEQSSFQYIRVLRLSKCGELEHLDLNEFPSLQSLTIWECPKLKLVTGWEVPTGLASLEIGRFDAYLDFPEVRYLSSLREIEVSGRKSNKSLSPWHLSQISQCAKLRRLSICHEESFSKIADLENMKELKFLEFLSLGYNTFSSIQGLSGFQALTTLELTGCQSLRRVPDLGCLKVLTHLDMSWSGVENIQGVEELHLLIFLDLWYCRLLEKIPFLGHLKALVYLDLRDTCVKDIPSRDDLINVKTLKWNPAT